MAGNRFGSHFRITTFGESHGRAIGAIVVATVWAMVRARSATETARAAWSDAREKGALPEPDRSFSHHHRGRTYSPFPTPS